MSEKWSLWHRSFKSMQQELEFVTNIKFQDMGLVDMFVKHTNI
jgi:hypothetical protein